MSDDELRKRLSPEPYGECYCIPAPVDGSTRRILNDKEFKLGLEELHEQIAAAKEAQEGMAQPKPRVATKQDVADIASGALRFDPENNTFIRVSKTGK